jgi:hypothetical protein
MDRAPRRPPGPLSRIQRALGGLKSGRSEDQPLSAITPAAIPNVARTLAQRWISALSLF